MSAHLACSGRFATDGRNYFGIYLQEEILSRIVCVMCARGGVCVSGYVRCLSVLGRACVCANHFPQAQQPPQPQPPQQPPEQRRPQQDRGSVSVGGWV